MKFLLTSLLSLSTFYCTAQCPEFYDFEGTLSSRPSWISCDGNDFVLSLQSNFSIGNYSIDWGDGICTDTAYRSISVTNKTSGNIIIPNSFAPNENNPNYGDFQQKNEINDIFYPVILGAKNYELDIYNRWDENLFSTKDQSIGWNGYFKNQLCETGIYIYKIKVVFLNGEEQKIIGQVTLVR